jgi:predicted outer membrane protein
MSKPSFSVVALAVVAFTTLSTIQAQDTEQNRSRLNPDQSAGLNTDQAQRYEARRVTPDADDRSGPTVKEAIVQKLIKANEAEIELAKLAQQKSDNQEIKQLTEMIVKDHQALNQTLQQHAGRSTDTAKSNNNPTSQRNTDVVDNPQQTQPRVPQQLCDIGEQACDNALKMTKKLEDDRRRTN